MGEVGKYTDIKKSTKNIVEFPIFIWLEYEQDRSPAVVGLTFHGRNTAGRQADEQV